MIELSIVFFAPCYGTPVTGSDKPGLNDIVEVKDIFYT